MDARTALALVLTVVLVVANGFFVAAEYAFVRVRKTQLDEIAQQGSARARLASRVLDRLDQYISASQLGVTLCSLAIGWIGEPAVALLLGPLFTWLPQPCRRASLLRTSQQASRDRRNTSRCRCRQA